MLLYSYIVININNNDDGSGDIAYAKASTITNLKVMMATIIAHRALSLI